MRIALLAALTAGCTVNLSNPRSVSTSPDDSVDQDTDAPATEDPEDNTGRPRTLGDLTGVWQVTLISDADLEIELPFEEQDVFMDAHVHIHADETAELRGVMGDSTGQDTWQQALTWEVDSDPSAWTVTGFFEAGETVMCDVYYDEIQCEDPDVEGINGPLKVLLEFEGLVP